MVTKYKSPTDYTFIFDDIVDGYSSVSIRKSNRSTSDLFRISINESAICIYSGTKISALQADLIDLAVAIHFTDKLTPPRKKTSNNIHVRLPLRCPEIFNYKIELLSDLLSWYTRDNWQFNFVNRKSVKRNSERKNLTLIDNPIHQFPVEYALWSGGLDSLAGLKSRMLENYEKHFVLVGIGSNRIMQSRQKQVFHTLNWLSKNNGRLHYLNVPIEANYGKRYFKNSTNRARGLVFILVGIVAAMANKKNRLNIYENGIGAINLAFPGGVGRDHSRAVHPRSLMKIENYINQIINCGFSIVNPFIFLTKAEMCSSLHEEPIPVFETISCDRLHREKYIQCGYCSSCILRRLSLVSANIIDRTKYFVPHGRNPEGRHLAYWRKMNEQVRVIKKGLDSDDDWVQLCIDYPDNLRETAIALAGSKRCEESCVINSILRLYRKYVNEWNNSSSIIFQSLKNKNCDSLVEARKWRQMCLIK